MKRIGLVLVAMLVAAGIAVPQEQPQAQKDKTPRVEKREKKQQARINQGIKSGELTTKEANRLEKEQTRVKENEEKAKSDGTVTPKERQKLTKEQNKANRDIYKLKHNKKKARDKTSG